MFLRACTPRRVEKGGLRKLFFRKRKTAAMYFMLQLHLRSPRPSAPYLPDVWRKRPSNCTFSHLRKDFLTNGVISTERKIDFARISAVSPFLAYVGVIMRTFFVVFPTPGGGGGKTIINPSNCAIFLPSCLPPPQLYFPFPDFFAAGPQIKFKWNCHRKRPLIVNLEGKS